MVAVGASFFLNIVRAYMGFGAQFCFDSSP